MTSQLIALANGRQMGSIISRNGRLAFVYDEAWRHDQESYPLSLSTPLASAEHGHSRIEPFLWGLLPDNDRILESWGRRFQVSARNAFRLVAHVGEDCAGAVQFVRPDRLERLRSEKAAREITWLTEDDIAGGCARCALITPHGAPLPTQASSAWQAPNRRQPCCTNGAAGVCLRAAHRPLIY